MARPTKQGVDYFPLDVYLDDKFKFIEIKFGLEGFAILIKLFQKIYSAGYYCEWQEDEIMLFADENRTTTELVENVVSEATERGIFNKSLYQKYNILTSNGIQKRYQEIVKRRKDVTMIDEYLLVEGNFGINDNTMSTSRKQDDDIIQTESKHNDNKSTQSKVKESKVLEHSTFFEEVWSLYPNKVGKGKISDTKKEEIYKLGDEFKRCINRYIAYVEARRKNDFPELKYQNGSTFFNSGYVDYLDKNYKDDEVKKEPMEPFVPKFVYFDL